LIKSAEPYIGSGRIQAYEPEFCPRCGSRLEDSKFYKKPDASQNVNGVDGLF